MKLAVLSDIHSNLEALEAVLQDARVQGYDRLVCLGDLVGYGANPTRCIELLRQSVYSEEGLEWVVRGNHDHAVACGADEYFNPSARQAARWTRNQLDCEALSWLAELPYTLSKPDYLLVHASPALPRNWKYVTSLNEASEAFEESEFYQQVGFIGHSHVPFTVTFDRETEQLNVIREPEMNLDRGGGFRYLVNVGSVGQPRDGDWRSSYVLFDTENLQLVRRRVEYPVQVAMEKIRSAGLPEFLADRLAEGR